MDTSSWLVRPQRRLEALGLMVLLAVSNTIVPFSLDMYTPSVPELPEYFSTTPAVVNLTLVAFYLFFAIGILLFGPVSDRYGRKPVLIGGFIAYVAGSALCALAEDIWLLIGFRVLQALGAGAICAITTALVKDCFHPEKRARLLAALQIMQVLGPVCAPLIGGVILLFSTWHTTFWLLAVLGGACLALSLLLEETVTDENRLQGSPLRALTRLGVVARNHGFVLLLVVVSLFSMPFMAYVAAASYVYVGFFGLTEQMYSYFFAATAALAIIGPVAYLRFAYLLPPRKFIRSLIVVCLGASILLFVAGERSPLLFCGCFLIFAVCEAAIRPGSVNILLAQQDGDTGSASSLINFTMNVFGTVGMMLVMLPWRDYVVGLASIMFGCMALSLVLFVLLLRSSRFHVKELEK